MVYRAQNPGRPTNEKLARPMHVRSRMVANISEFVRDLGALGRNDIPVAGGKGANLGEMTSAGLPVPPGFVVTGQAYLHALDAQHGADGGDGCS